MTDLEMLNEMIELQKQYDLIVFEKFKKSYADIDIETALLDEVGELNHELKAEWCWWKEHPGKVCRKKVREELVDCIHFILMMAIGSQLEKSLKAGFEDAHRLTLEEMKNRRIEELVNADGNIRWLGMLMYCIAMKLGFTWSEIYEEYKYKNHINVLRQQNRVLRWDRKQRGKFSLVILAGSVEMKSMELSLKNLFQLK